MYPGFQQRDNVSGGIFETLFGFFSALEDEKFRHYFV